MDHRGAFAKVFQKTLNRTKAKVLQNLGKADKTTDEKFEEHVANFSRQQVVATRLHKEVKHYVNCVKAMTAASRSLYTVIQDTYEPEWVDLHSIDSAIRSLDMLYSNYEAELFERVCTDLHTYVELFNPMKEKINKRRRKLLDYDNAKHSYESAFNAKKPDDIRKSRASDSLHEAERLYNDLNSELHRELPKFYNYRIDFVASNLSRLYSTESTFHQETGKITDQLYNMMERVPKAGDQPSYSDKCDPDESPATHNYNVLEQPGLDLTNLDQSMQSSILTEKTEHLSSPDVEYSNVASDHTEEGGQEHEEEYTAIGGGVSVGYAVDAVGGDGSTTPSPRLTQRVVSSTTASEHHVDANIPDSSLKKSTNDMQSKVQGRHKSENGQTILLAESIATVYDVPSTPPKAVQAEREVDDSVYQNLETVETGEESDGTQAITAGQQVLATHNYKAEDEDELSFEAGELIEVVEFDDPDEKDEGWLMGMSKKTGRKGVFPENFTRKLIPRNSKS